jgi:hypothetical protein
MKKWSIIRNIAIYCALLSGIGLAFYNTSQDRPLGLTAIDWKIIWSVAVNLLSISVILVAMSYSEKYIRWFLGLVFLPYLTVKTVYDISTYGQIYIIPPEGWFIAWEILIFDLLLSGLIFSFIMFNKWQKR